MALLESTDSGATIAGQPTTGENKPVMSWALIPPIVILVVIIAVHFLSGMVSTRAEGEKPWADDPILLQASTTSKPRAGSFLRKASVSSIAYGKSHAVAFINDQMVSEGAVVDGMTVLKIHENAVQFEKDGKQWTQEVGE